MTGQDSTQPISVTPSAAQRPRRWVRLAVGSSLVLVDIFLFLSVLLGWWMRFGEIHTEDPEDTEVLVAFVAEVTCAVGIIGIVLALISLRWSKSHWWLVPPAAAIVASLTLAGTLDWSSS